MDMMMKRMSTMTTIITTRRGFGGFTDLTKGLGIMIRFMWTWDFTIHFMPLRGHRSTSALVDTMTTGAGAVTTDGSAGMVIMPGIRSIATIIHGTDPEWVTAQAGAEMSTSTTTMAAMQDMVVTVVADTMVEAMVHM
jgi:hypothetical protein